MRTTTLLLSMAAVLWATTAAASWPQYGTILTTLPGDLNGNDQGALTPDGAGGLFATITVGNTQPDNLRLFHIGHSGDIEYLGYLGILARQVHSDPVPDGQGGMYVVVSEPFSTYDLPGYRIRLFRFDSSGQTAPGWPAAGSVIGSEQNLYRPGPIRQFFASARGDLVVNWLGVSFYSGPGNFEQTIQRVSGTNPGATIVHTTTSDVGPLRPYEYVEDGMGRGFLIEREDESSVDLINRLTVRGLGSGNVAYWSQRITDHVWKYSCLPDGIGGMYVTHAAASSVPGYMMHRRFHLPKGGLPEPTAPDLGDHVPEMDGVPSDLEWFQELPSPDGGSLLLFRSTDGFRAIHWLPSGQPDPDTDPGGNLLLPLVTSSPTVVPDGAGGAFVAYVSDFIRVARVLPGGRRPPYEDWLGEPVTSTPVPGSSRQIRSLRAISNDEAVLLYSERRPVTGEIAWGVTHYETPRPVAVQASLVSSEATRDHVQLVWELDQPAGSIVTAERRSAGDDWGMLADLSVDGAHRVTLRDEDVRRGRAYEYRLRSGADAFGAATVAVPAGVLALSAPRPHPAKPGAELSMELATDDPATCELFDLAGRRVWQQSLPAGGAGSRALSLGRGTALTPGVYLARLTQAGSAVSRRIVIAE